MNEKIDVKIGSKEEAAWKIIHDKAVLELEQTKRAIEITKAIIVLAARRMQEEKEKFK